MTKRVTIEKIEPLSHRWVKLDRYTIRYSGRTGRPTASRARCTTTAMAPPCCPMTRSAAPCFW